MVGWGEADAGDEGEGDAGEGDAGAEDEGALDGGAGGSAALLHAHRAANKLSASMIIKIFFIMIPSISLIDLITGSYRVRSGSALH